MKTRFLTETYKSEKKDYTLQMDLFKMRLLFILHSTHQEDFTPRPRPFQPRLEFTLTKQRRLDATVATPGIPAIDIITSSCDQV